MRADAGLDGRIDLVLSSYGLKRHGTAVPITTGTLNRNYRVRTDGGTVLARCHRSDVTAERIRAEHLLIGWAVARGIPAVAPISFDAKSGHQETLIESDSELWALFPWIDGRMIQRGSMTASQARALGTMHRYLQRELAEAPALNPISSGIQWDTERVLLDLAHLGSVAAAMNAPDALLDGIMLQQQLLLEGHARAAIEFADLPQQLLHGDFHDQQVLLADDDTVLLVFDWENYRIAPRVWELLRSLAFSELLENPDAVAQYLAGYRHSIRLTADECYRGVELWWQTRLHSTWVYSAYLQGNERVAPFFTGNLEHLRRLAPAGWRSELARHIASAAVG